MQLVPGCEHAASPSSRSLSLLCARPRIRFRISSRVGGFLGERFGCVVVRVVRAKLLCYPREMGTWGEALYDNDGALDVLDDLFKELNPDVDGPHLVGTLGLLLQFSPSSVDAEEWRDRITNSPYRGQLSETTRATLDEIAGDAEAAAEGRSRPEAHRALLGSYCDGPRYASLFEAPGVGDVVAGFVDRIQAQLDEGLAGVADPDLYEIADVIAPIGLLLDLGCSVDRPRLATWERVFAAADEATDDERDFWDGYVSCVRGVFDLLEQRAAAP